MSDDSQALETEIRRRITGAGPMPVGQYMALCLTDPKHGYYMKRDPLEKSYGWIGRSLLSVSVAADGPSPWPVGPWHFQHSIFWNSSRPCRILSMEGAGSGGIVIGVPGFPVFHFGENVLM